MTTILLEKVTWNALWHFYWMLLLVKNNIRMTYLVIKFQVHIIGFSWDIYKKLFSLKITTLTVQASPEIYCYDRVDYSPVLPRICQKSPTFGYSYRTRNILPRPGSCRKALFLVIPTVLEISYQGSCRKALRLVILTVLEVFYQGSCRKTLFLVIPTVLELFYQD